MPGRGWSLSLVIPAFNEAEGIEAAIAEADDTLARIAENYEVLVVDDGSRDATFAVANRVAASRPKVRILRHEVNRGYGAALRTGFEAATFDLVAFTDADCQFDLTDLARMAPLAESSPIVAGYRIDRKDPWRRRFLSRGYNVVARSLLGTRVRDCDCALKVFRKAELAHLLPNSNNFFVNTEMLTRARQRRLPVVELGVAHRPRRSGVSKVSMGDVPKTLATLLPFWWTRVMFAGAPGPTGSERGSLPALLLVMIVAALFFFNRLSTPLLEPEEARYAEISRQMLDAGTWLVPHLHGQPYLDKPPLLYWAVMSSYRIFGVHDWAARIIPGLAGLLTVMVTFGWCRRVVGTRAALVGTLVLLTSANFIYYGRMLGMNGLLALFTTAALASGHLLMLPDTRRRWIWSVALGASLGLGLLTKGPVIVALTLPPLAVLALFDIRLRRPGLASLAAIVAMMAVVAMPWYLLVGARHPEFAGYFFWFHNIQRFAQPFDHQGPPWEYLPGLILGIMPWSLLLLPVGRYLSRRAQRAAQRRPAALGLFLGAFVWMLLFFSLAGSKRPAYLVPLFPPLALTLGCAIDAWLPRPRWGHLFQWLVQYRDRLAYTITTASLALGVVGSAAWLSAGTFKPERVVLLGAGCAIILAVVLTRARQYRLSWLPAGLAVFTVFFFGFNTLLPEYSRRFTLRHPIHVEIAHRVTTDKVFCYPHRWDSLTFYLPGINTQTFDRTQRGELMRALEQSRTAIVVVQTKHRAELTDALPLGLEFVPLREEPTFTIGEVRTRREAPLLITRR